MQEVILFASILWLAFGFGAWLVLIVLAGLAVRKQDAAPPADSDGDQMGGWKPSAKTTRGLALTGLYLSLVLVPLGISAMVGWNAFGDDRFGVFFPMTVLADLLTIGLVTVYVRLVILLRRGIRSPGRVLWIAFAATVLGQAAALAVLLITGLPHAPTLFGS